LDTDDYLWANKGNELHLIVLLYIWRFKPIVANGFVSKYLNIRLFWTKHKEKWRSFQISFNEHLKVENIKTQSVDSDGPGCKICHVGY